MIWYQVDIICLTHCLVTPYGVTFLVNIVSGNGLLPGGTKPLPGPILTNKITSQGISQLLITKIS